MLKWLDPRGRLQNERVLENDGWGEVRGCDQGKNLTLLSARGPGLEPRGAGSPTVMGRLCLCVLLGAELVPDAANKCLVSAS